MKLFARVIEGNLEGEVYQATSGQVGYNEAWKKGKELWDAGEISKYEIGVFTDEDRLFWSLRPDKINFEENILRDCFVECAKEELESFLSEDFQKDTLEMGYALEKQHLWLQTEKFREMIPAQKCLQRFGEDFVNTNMRKAGFEHISIRAFEVYSTGELKGYGQGLLYDEKRNSEHEFLFRFADPANGERNTLVSVDYGCNMGNAKEVVTKFEDCLRAFALKEENVLQKMGVYDLEKKPSLDEKVAKASIKATLRQNPQWVMLSEAHVSKESVERGL